ncbi:hypothetical protein AAW51_1285 [Caldimonas brevitalea]|uniref:Uncharacterized protein n=1 Tax=Caldimonas brevitalea TaxID=413882 RepID=A0A0G3BKT9_9BURK|nr:hypothetical protein AAW51_1285 [Caldimonas brevitalea]
MADLKRAGPIKWRTSPLTTQAHLGPTRPDVRGPARPSAEALALSGKRLSALKQERLQGRVDAATAMITAQTPVGSGAPQAPKSRDAFRSRQACEAAITTLLGPGSEALAERVLAHAVPGPSGRPFERPLMIATALHKVCHQDTALAAQLLDGLAGGVASLPPEQAVFAHRLQRLLAATPAGMDALCAMEGGPATPALREAYEAALQISSLLLERGVNPGGTASLEAFHRVAVAHPESGRRIGEGDDHRDRLAHKALMWAMAVRTGDMHGVDATHHAAYVAWQNGFTESGKNSDFSRALQRLHKFIPYAERGETGVKRLTPKTVVESIGRAFAKPFGKGLSPMTHMREGAQGATLGDLKTEQEAFRTGLEGAILRLRAPLHAEAGRLIGLPARTANEEAVLNSTLVKLAVLDHWREVGRKDIKPQAQDIEQRAAQLFSGHRVDPRIVQRELKGMDHKLRLKTLEAWAQGVGGLDGFGQDIAKLRETARGEKQRPKVFTVDDMRALALELVRGNDVARFSEGGTTGLSVSAGLGVAGFQSPSLGAGPDVKAETGRHATVQFGVSGVGGEVFIGTERRKAAHAGVNVSLGWPAGSRVGIGASVGAKVGGETLAAEGVAIRTRKGSGDAWKEKTAEVVNFLFDQVRPSDGQTRPADKADLWQRYADRYGNDPDVSFTFVSHQAKTTKAGVSAGAGASVNIAGLRLGPSVSAGLEHNRMSALRDDRAGKWTTTVAGQGIRNNLALGASLAASAPAVQLGHATAQGGPGGPNGIFTTAPPVQSVSLPGLALLGAGTDITLRTENGVTRLTKERGRLTPELCSQQREFGSANEFIAYLESQRAQWEPVIGERDADGVLVGGAAKFDTFLREVKALAAKGNQTFVEGRSLRPEVADLIDAYHAQAQSLRGVGDVNSHRAPLEPAAALELQALDQEMHRLLTEPSSWRPSGASASEATSTLKENGVELVLKLTARGEASANRTLVKLSAEPNAAEPPSRPLSQAAEAAVVLPPPIVVGAETPVGSRAETRTTAQTGEANAAVPPSQLSSQAAEAAVVLPPPIVVGAETPVGSRAGTRTTARPTEPNAAVPPSRLPSQGAEAAVVLPPPMVVGAETPVGSRAETPTTAQAAEENTDAAIRARARALMDEIYAEVEGRGSPGSAS